MTETPATLATNLPSAVSLFEGVGTHVREFTIIAGAVFGNSLTTYHNTIVQRVAAQSPHLAVGVAFERTEAMMRREGDIILSWTPLIAMLSETEMCQFDDSLLCVLMERYGFEPLEDDDEDEPDHEYLYGQTTFIREVFEDIGDHEV